MKDSGTIAVIGGIGLAAAGLLVWYLSRETPLPCTTGEKRNPVTCSDLSVIHTEVCTDGVWGPSGETCGGTGGCTEGEKRSPVTCWDGSTIYEEICSGDVWVSSGETCPTEPPASAWWMYTGPTNVSISEYQATGEYWYFTAILFGENDVPLGGVPVQFNWLKDGEPYGTTRTLLTSDNPTNDPNYLPTGTLSSTFLNPCPQGVCWPVGTIFTGMAQYTPSAGSPVWVRRDITMVV